MLPRGAALPAAPRCLPDPRPSAAPSPRQVYAGINSSVDTYARTYDLLWKYGPQALRFPLRKANSVRFFSMFVTSQLFGMCITVGRCSEMWGDIARYVHHGGPHEYDLYLPVSPCISLYLPTSPYISLYLPISPFISLYLPTS